MREDGLGQGRGEQQAALCFGPAPAGLAEPEADEIDLLRSEEYNLLALVLGRAPGRDLLGRLVKLTGDKSELGSAHIALAQAAAVVDAEAVQREFFELFVGLGRGELLPYASYYRTGFLNERPLAAVREDLGALGIERLPDHPEPEDHIAILLEVMAGLASRQFSGDRGAERRFFERHLKPWAERFFADLEAAESARFYRAVGALGRGFMKIEAEAFAMDAQ